MSDCLMDDSEGATVISQAKAQAPYPDSPHSCTTLRKLLRNAEPGGAGGDDESEYRRDQLA